MAQLTITIDPAVEKKLQLLAKKRNRSVSGIINELIKNESKKLTRKTPVKGLGTYLSELPLTSAPNFTNEKEALGKLKEEKHLRQA